MNTNTLPTEQINPRTQGLDKMTPRQLARAFNAEDFIAARAVQKANKEIAAVIILAARAYAAKKKIIFMGAGTSGRLGILEAVECVPTFGTKPSQIIGLIAGGKQAVFRAKEGAEDNDEQGSKEILKIARSGDLVIGLTASGRTPYVMGGLQAARKLGARTALVSCNAGADASNAEVHICLETGPEALSGSTRMKAGTATKMALNAITTGAMTLCGKTYGNLMIDVRPTNEKLVARAVRLICQVAGTDKKNAEKLLAASGKSVKTAVVMHKKHTDKPGAEKLLKKQNGFLSKVIDG
uniref:N-acetylmuramic acid 6-phosphate etherase n=1 Tax=uncultured Elusimicrobia bacterium TaxID=699876 RepID=A0A650EMM7_9BACT|nr:N-acetylmuramic acid 6-phosphate etherase [uncultured Elusimicrobia bacterium]